MDTSIDSRLSALHAWLSGLFHETTAFTITPLTGDASFRRYFRVIIAKKTFIVMDAPPEKEDCTAFIAIADAFKNASARFPHIISHDLNQGFLLLPDFGDRQLLPSLENNAADKLYQSAMTTLSQIQQCSIVPNYNLPCFNAVLYWREFEIFDTWYIKKRLGKQLSNVNEKKLKSCYQLLIDSANAQPQVFVHRDYHSRNIMVCDDGELGVLDFQDAVLGPITYDLVSLLRDCYIAWPDDQVEKWVRLFYQQLNLSLDFKIFMRWFDLMGLQRHLKCLGIFSRLYYRDGKEAYLKEIPRVLNYVMTVCNKYPELQLMITLL
ncbi:MAG: hypothetical protein A3E82_04030 [Gammaproteobacteria bacterium RIFCSPHIGHO2_12_FULL_38_11]|nr:MAG: hypothetical protein A3E82_04030 [Gammaproteobacteria bacterium RIFCSPHIGHO2_12_FULL_38_11]